MNAPPQREAPPPRDPPPDKPSPRRDDERTDERTVLAIAGPLLFTPPALALADRDVTILGVPSLVVYVFAAWLVGILLTAVVSRPRRP